MNALTILKTVLTLLPTLIDTIKLLEQAIPGQGQGEAKLAALRGMIEAVYGPATELWPAIERTVSALVAVFNRAGALRP